MAGGQPPILTPEAVGALGKFGRGRPRLLNSLADNALYEAYLAGRPAVEAYDVERAATDLGVGPDPGDTFVSPQPDRRAVGWKAPAAAAPAAEAPAAPVAAPAPNEVPMEAVAVAAAAPVVAAAVAEPVPPPVPAEAMAPPVAQAPPPVPVEAAAPAVPEAVTTPDFPEFEVPAAAEATEPVAVPAVPAVPAAAPSAAPEAAAPSAADMLAEPLPEEEVFAMQEEEPLEFAPPEAMDMPPIEPPYETPVVIATDDFEPGEAATDAADLLPLEDMLEPNMPEAEEDLLGPAREPTETDAVDGIFAELIEDE